MILHYSMFLIFADPKESAANITLEFTKTGYFLISYCLCEMFKIVNVSDMCLDETINYCNCNNCSYYK